NSDAIYCLKWVSFKRNSTGSATFENPVILSQWRVKRVGAVESAIHATLKSRGKWRENVPGTEWFDTTLSEIETIVKFITQQ
ncbi:MAG: GIY-YIG nuclease family protein, partial [Gallionellaceae bacterium]